METEDERRYAAFLAQEEAGQKPDDPLQQIKNIRKQQLLVCDMEKRREMAQMLEQQGEEEGG